MSGLLSRRQFLRAGAGAAALVTLGTRAALAESASAPPAQAEALRVLGRRTLRQPGSLPFPGLRAGTDTMPGIEHIVVLVLENHSYDNVLGMLGKGDGFALDRHGRPTASNPTGTGKVQHAFHMPTTCQVSGKPSQEWEATHHQYAGGRLDGFVTSPSGPVSMGYWTEDDLPFTYGLARAFATADRWFCSALTQTDPNRRFIIAATAAGMTDDIETDPAKLAADPQQYAALLVPPPNGTVFSLLAEHGISFKDYSVGWPIVTPNLFPVPDGEIVADTPFSQFFTDAAAGRLPSFTFLDENMGVDSQENPQNMVNGEAVLSQVVHALGTSPAWDKTLFVVTYDEHGGYYDHVPPPVALAPDDIPLLLKPGEQAYDGFSRYGFRVPAVVVSPYARPGHVTHVVHDHTSILAMVERKWNLPALTLRDANANDLTDFLDLGALAARRPTFPALPKLARPGNTAARLACSRTGSGTIPPPASVSS